MREGDRIRHRRDGAGTVLRVYQARSTARCRMDTGKVTVYSTKRLRPGPSVADPDAGTPTAPARRRGRGRMGGGEAVDYALLDRARRHVEGLHPEADHVVPRIYGGRTYVEVWKDGAAQIVFCEERQEDG